MASRQQSVDIDINRSALDKDKTEDTDIQNGRLSVFVHKRDDQFSHEVIQPLLRYSKTIDFYGYQFLCFTDSSKFEAMKFVSLFMSLAKMEETTNLGDLFL